MNPKSNLLAAAFTAIFLAIFPTIGFCQVNQRPDQEDKKTYRVTLEIEGVECDACADLMNTTLKSTEIKLLEELEPNSEGPTRVKATFPMEGELGKAATMVEKAQTPHRESAPPTLTLVLFAEVDDETSKAAMTVFENLEGVDGDESSVDTEEGELLVRIDGEESISVEEILSALNDAGIEAKTSMVATP